MAEKYLEEPGIRGRVGVDDPAALIARQLRLVDLAEEAHVVLAPGSGWNFFDWLLLSSLLSSSTVLAHSRSFCGCSLSLSLDLFISLSLDLSCLLS